MKSLNELMAYFNDYDNDGMTRSEQLIIETLQEMEGRIQNLQQENEDLKLKVEQLRKAAQLSLPISLF